MSPDRVAVVQTILNSDDLAIGFSTQDPERPYTLAGDGQKLRMTHDVALLILSLIERAWGRDAPEAIILRGILDPCGAEVAT